MLQRTLQAGFIAPCLPTTKTPVQRSMVADLRWLTRLGSNGVFGIEKEHDHDPKPIVLGIVFSSIVFATASTQAQVIVDVSKITCDQFVHAKIATPLYLAAWLYQAAEWLTL